MKTNTINIAQMKVIPGNPEKNLKNIIKHIKNASSDLIVFPEMAIPGYFLWDEWENESFVKECFDMNREIIDSTKWWISAIWWNVLVDEVKQNEDGSFRKYNAWFIAQNGQKISNWVFDWYTIKSLMPKYKQFDDERYFYSLDKLAREEWKSLENYFKPFEIVINGIKRNVWIVVCEDMWDTDYQIKPVELLKDAWSDIIINISASPYGIAKQSKRDKILREKSKWIDFVYANNVWIQNTWKNIFTFDWNSKIYRDAKEIFANKLFESNSKQEEIYQVLVYAIKEFMDSIKKNKAVIWLSGWIDSAIVATLLVDAIWAENVIAINMPSKYNSATTKNIAKNLASDLGIKYIDYSIQDSVDKTKADLEEIFWKEIKWLVLENIQARDRWARVLSAIASIEDSVFTANWNKTEIALGYATLYWDISWAFAPIWDLYKTQVYDLARFLNEKKAWILNDVINVMPSAELSEHQDVEAGKWDPFNYEFVDKVLYQLIEERKDLDYILELFLDWKLEEKLKFDKKIVPEIFASNTEFIANIEKIYKLFKINFFKRVQSPPIISLSKRAFWTDLRESQNWLYFTRKYRKLRDEIIKWEKLDEIYDRFLRDDFAWRVKEKFHEIFLEDAWVWEAYSISTHTNTVLKNFENFFAHDEIFKTFDIEIFKLILALHDIGKPEAIKNETKEAQHKYTTQMINNFFQELKVEKKYKNFAKELIWIDVIWEYLQGKIALEEAKTEVKKAASKSGFSFEIFTHLLSIFFRCDAGTYTTGAGHFESLDRLFVFDFDKKVLDFSREVKGKVNNVLN